MISWRFTRPGFSRASRMPSRMRRHPPAGTWNCHGHLANASGTPRPCPHIYQLSRGALPPKIKNQAIASLPLSLLVLIVAFCPTIARAQFNPATIRQAYGFNLLSSDYVDGVTGAGQTIAVIDPYGATGNVANGKTNIYADVATFDTQYGLPALTQGTSLKVIGQTGNTTGLPGYNASWAEEATLDVEYAHAIAPQANIELVEPSSANYSDLTAAANYAATNGASVVSMSWSGDEEPQWDSNLQVAGTTFVASTGDGGSAGGIGYPASSPYVVGVGGTTLSVDKNGNYAGETAWSGTGGGVSTTEAEPSYQNGVQSTGMRTEPDVAFDADPNTGVAIVFGGNTLTVGGTSVGAPAWAGLFALADQERIANGLTPLSSVQALEDLYAIYGTSAYSMAFHDITSGSNGAYAAGVGYDDVTGLGSPIANTLVPYLGGSSLLPDIPTPEPASAALLFTALPLLLRRPSRPQPTPNSCN